MGLVHKFREGKGLVLLTPFALVVMVGLMSLAAMEAQEDEEIPSALSLLSQVHASRRLVSDHADRLSRVLSRCETAWSQEKGSSLALEPEGAKDQAEALSWLKDAVRDPFPGVRERTEFDRESVARYLLLARSDLPPEAMKLSAPCKDLEELLTRVREKVTIAEEKARAWEVWRGRLSGAVIESPSNGEPSWSGELKVKMPAAARAEVYLLGEFVEPVEGGTSPAGGRYEDRLRPRAGIWQGLAVVGLDADGKALSASRIVWVKGSTIEPKWSEPTGQTVAAKPPPIAPGDREIEVVLFEGFEEVPRSEPDPVAEFHQGRGLKWAAEGVPRLYPRRIRHKETGLVLLLVPPGKLWMGSPEISEAPLHEVELREPFYLAETEVTQAQYERVMSTNPSEYRGASLPVQNVNWEEASDFCSRIGGELPTEAQWEYACRAGTRTAFAFGLELAPDRARFAKWYDDGPVTVRSFHPND